MGDPNAPALDGLALIETLDRHGVDYVLVGGLAATVHGATRLTTDMDVVPQWTASNHGRLALALRELNAGLRVEGVPDPVDYPLDERTFTAFEVSTWRTDLGDIDVIVGIPTHTPGRLRGFDELVTDSGTFRIGTSEVRVGSLDHIVESKAALGRPSDLAALDELREMQDLRRIGPTGGPEATDNVSGLTVRNRATSGLDGNRFGVNDGLDYAELATALVKETLLTRSAERATITRSGREELSAVTARLNGVAVKIATTPEVVADTSLNRVIEDSLGPRPHDDDRAGQRRWDVHFGRAALIAHARSHLSGAMAELIIAHHETSQHQPAPPNVAPIVQPPARAPRSQ